MYSVYKLLKMCWFSRYLMFNVINCRFQNSILDQTDKDGKTALFYAVEFGYLDITSYLLLGGANVNFR